MAEAVDMCHPADLKFVLEYDGKQFKGGMGNFIEDVLSDLKRGANITVNVRSKDDGIGEPIHGTNDEIYTGCIGLIQRNQSDFMLQMTNYPLPAINLSQGAVMMDSSLQFLNTYIPPDQSVVVQIESMFNSFTPAIWILSTIILITCISCLLIHSHSEKLSRQMSHKKCSTSSDRNLTYQVATHMTRCGQLDNTTGCVMKIIFLVLSFFSFIVIFYLCSVVKTELVVVPPPITMRSYEEMLQHGCGVFFFRGQDTHQFFKSATDGSDAKKLWQFTASQFPMDVIIYDGNIDKAKFVLEPMIAGKLAFISESIWMRNIIKEFCAIAVDDKRLEAMASFMKFKLFKTFTVFPLVSQDEKTTNFLKAFVASQHKSPPLIRLRRTFSRIFESGLPSSMLKILSSTEFSDSLLSFPRQRGNYGFIQNCVHGNLFVPESHLESVTRKNIANLPRLFASLLTSSCFLLIFELFLSALHKKKFYPPQLFI